MRSACWWVSIVLLSINTAHGAEVKAPWLWSLSYGRFSPDIEAWERHYGREEMPVFALAWGYPLASQWVVGAGVDYGTEQGTGRLVQNDQVGGQVTYKWAP
ncbi:MAG: hypothetical protein FD130_180, partial [Halothiobacillaceae bacterium]